jgi:hypothetical protein
MDPYALGSTRATFDASSLNMSRDMEFLNILHGEQHGLQFDPRYPWPGSTRSIPTGPAAYLHR